MTTPTGHLVPDDVDMLLDFSQPHVVLQLAAKVGGIGANRLTGIDDRDVLHRYLPAEELRLDLAEIDFPDDDPLLATDVGAGLVMAP